jgi:predicted thioesterase
MNLLESVERSILQACTFARLTLIHGGEALRSRSILPHMAAKLDIGRSYQSQTRVEEWMTAEKAGNKGIDVLSTPMLLQLIEEAAMHCLAPMLGPNEVSLGSHIELSHLAPTPVGFIVRIEVETIGVDGRRVNFAVAAFDEREKVAEGTHERYVIDRARFLANLEDKQS